MFGADWSDPGTFWINATNLALGIIVLVAIVGVASAWGVDLREWLEARSRRASHPVLVAPSPHAYFEPELGLTMADGGEAKAPNPADDKPPFWD